MKTASARRRCFLLITLRSYSTVSLFHFYALVIWIACWWTANTSWAIETEFAVVNSFDALTVVARDESQKPHQQRATLPTVLDAMTYQDYVNIVFRPQRATWKDERPFYLETFHRGFVQRDRVRIFTITEGQTSEIPFSADDFTYQPPLDRRTIPKDLGHAGLKILSAVDGLPGGQEMLTFLGASYFRGRSITTHYGTSARGLAIDVAMNKQEQFPFFKAFWVVQPPQDAKELEVLALLDGPSVVGAYRFRFQPGLENSRVHVESTLFFREVPEKIAIAPLTSMWMWGDGLDGPAKDSRPAVHDCDGLLVQSELGNKMPADQSPTQPKSKWEWRAMARQSYPSVSRIEVDRLTGFGLLQRNRAFFHYDDHNARYDLRPSVWVRPDQPWTTGHLELLELPAAHEGVDNIAAYWVLDKKPQTNEPLKLSYEVTFFPGDLEEESSIGRATNFHLERPEKDLVEFEIRFAGESLKQLDASERIKVEAQAIRAEVVYASAQQTATGDWLAKVTIRLTEESPAELSVQLAFDGRQLTETFRYLCPPETPEFVYPAVYTRQE